MKKLKLAIEDLQVESLVTHRPDLWDGTIHAHLDTMDECNTNSPSICTCQNPCESDGFNTIDAVLCTSDATDPYGTSEQTFTCKPTGICCGGPSLNRTGLCCQLSQVNTCQGC